MKRFRIFFETGAEHLFRQLPPAVKPLLKQAIEGLAEDPYRGKQLHDELYGYYSLRYQRWRIIYTLDEPRKRIIIHLIDRRVTVYEALRAFPPLKVHETLRPYGRERPSFSQP